MERSFQKVSDDGIGLIHTIGRVTPPGGASPWINKYIFPGGYIPAMSEVMGNIEHNDLYVTDVEVLRLHYAKTLNRCARILRKMKLKLKKFMMKNSAVCGNII